MRAVTVRLHCAGRQSVEYVSGLKIIVWVLKTATTKSLKMPNGYSLFILIVLFISLISMPQINENRPALSLAKVFLLLQWHLSSEPNTPQAIHILIWYTHSDQPYAPSSALKALISQTHCWSSRALLNCSYKDSNAERDLLPQLRTLSEVQGLSL